MAEDTNALREELWSKVALPLYLQRAADAAAAGRRWHAARVGVEVLYHILFLLAAALSTVAGAAPAAYSDLSLVSTAVIAAVASFRSFAAFCKEREDAAERDLADVLARAGLSAPPAPREMQRER